MAKFSKRSQDNLTTCHDDLQRLFSEVIKYFDCTIIEGHRSKLRQQKLYEKGVTKTLNSKHNMMPSRAVDVVPYPIDWEDREQMHLFAGIVLGLAHSMNIKIRWGGDWDMDGNVKNNRFDDLVHFELI